MQLIRGLSLAAASALLLSGGLLAQGTLRSAGSLPHFVYGGGWRTTWFVVNTTSNPNAAVRLNFIGDDGNPLVIPLTNPLTGEVLTPASSASTTVPPYGMLAVRSDSANPVGTSGWVQVSTDSATTTVAESFQYTSLPDAAHNGVINVQEGGAPVVSVLTPGYLMPFVEAQGESMAVAIANITTSPISVTVTIRNYLGTVKGTHNITLTAQQHTAFLLGAEYPETIGVAGTIEFSTPAAGQFSVMGLSYNSTHAFTSVLSTPLSSPSN